MLPSDHQLESIRRHEQYAQVDPTNLSLLLQLGDLYHGVGRFDDALACYARSLDLQPNNPQARSRSASVLISLQRFGDAEKLLAGMVAEGDTDPTLRHNLGLAIYYQLRFEEARSHFAAAAAAGITAPSNAAYLARSLHQLGDMDAAISACEKWVALVPGTESKSYLALLHIDGGNVQTAHRLGLEVLAVEADNIDANVAVGSASMEHQESGRARRCFQIALRQDPENGRAWLGMGLVHLYDQQSKEAIHALSNATRLFPENAGIAVTHGWAHIIDGDAAGAQQVFERALEVDRTFSESHAGLAAALAMQNKANEAQTSLEYARRLDRHSIGADVAESFLLAVRGQQQAAANVFEHMLKKSPRKDVRPLLDQLRIYATKKGSVMKFAGQRPKRLDS